MKKMLLKIGEGFKKGFKRIPKRIYTFLFLAIVLGSLTFVLSTTFAEFFSKHIDIYKADKSYYSSAEDNGELSSQLRAEEKEIRQNYIKKDLNGISNPFEHAKFFILKYFAGIDIIGQAFILFAFLYADLKTIAWFLNPAFSIFSVESRQSRKKLKEIKKKEKKEKRISKHSLENA